MAWVVRCDRWWPDDVLNSYLRSRSVSFAIPWSGRQHAKQGDALFLALRDGGGVFALGTVERDSNEQATLAAAIDVAWNTILDPRLPANLLSIDTILEPGEDESWLSREDSDQLTELWANHVQQGSAPSMQAPSGRRRFGKAAAMRSIGATLRNVRWSWDATMPDGAIVFIAWSYKAARSQDGQIIACDIYRYGSPHNDGPGGRERLSHIEQLLDLGDHPKPATDDRLKTGH